MAYDEKIVERVRRFFIHQKVEEKHMFGGIAFMVNGKMCVTVNARPDHVMMIRIDPDSQNQILKRKGTKIAVMRGKKMTGWIFIENKAIEKREDFDYLVGLALDYNKHAKISKKKKVKH